MLTQTHYYVATIFFLFATYFHKNYIPYAWQKIAGVTLLELQQTFGQKTILDGDKYYKIYSNIPPVKWGQKLLEQTQKIPVGAQIVTIYNLVIPEVLHYLYPALSTTQIYSLAITHHVISVLTYYALITAKTDMKYYLVDRRFLWITGLHGAVLVLNVIVHNAYNYGHPSFMPTHLNVLIGQIPMIAGLDAGPQSAIITVIVASYSCVLALTFGVLFSNGQSDVRTYVVTSLFWVATIQNKLPFYPWLVATFIAVTVSAIKHFAGKNNSQTSFRKTKVPFVPYIFVGTAITILYETVRNFT